MARVEKIEAPIGKDDTTRGSAIVFAGQSGFLECADFSLVGECFGQLVFRHIRLVARGGQVVRGVFEFRMIGTKAQVRWFG